MLDFFIFAATFVTALLLAVFYLYPGSRKTGTTIPGMDPSDPKEGNLSDIQQAGSFHEFLVGLHQEYGPIASFWLDTQLIISLASPSVFQEHQHVFDRPGDLYSVFKPLIGTNSILYMNGSNARQQHKVLTEILAEATNEKYYATYTKMTMEIIHKFETLPQEQHVPLHQYMMALTIKLLLTILFGNYFNDPKNVLELRRNFEICTLDFEQKIQGKDLDENQSQKNKIAAAINSIREQMKLAMSNQKRQSSDSDAGLFVKFYSSLTGSEDYHIDNAITVIYEGFQTTGNLLTWLFYHVANDKEIQDKLRLEIASVVGDKDLSEEALSKCCYLKQVIQETLRRSCLQPFTARCVEMETEISGHLIPKATPIVHALGVVLMDETIWPMPEKFDPERFSEQQTKSRPPLAFSPWGFAGRRQCPGKSIAWTAASIVLVEFLRKMQISLAKGQTVRPFYSIVTKPEDEIWAIVAKNTVQA